MPYAWTAVSLNLVGLVLFLVPATRRNVITLNIGCLATYAGCYIEKSDVIRVAGPECAILRAFGRDAPVRRRRVVESIFADAFSFSAVR